MQYLTRSIAVIAVAMVLASAAVVGAEPDVTVDTVVNRYITALGGREAIEQLQTRECTGRVTSDLTARQPAIYDSHTFRIRARATHEYLWDDLKDGPGRTSGFDGTQGWTQTECGLRPDDKVGTGKIEWLANPQNALRIKEYFPGLTFAGTDWADGRECYVLAPADRKPLYYSLYFDIETGLLVWFGDRWVVTDYREVDGVLFPHKIVAGRKGGSTTYVFESVRHNAELPDSLFKMP